MNSNSNEALWEDLFAQATEDISAYLGAVNALREPSGDTDPTHVILSVLTYRHRSRKALDRMQSGVPEPLEKHFKQLTRLWDKSETVLQRLLNEKGEGFFKDLSAAIDRRIKETSEILETVRQTAQDGDLIEDPEWIKDELTEAAQNFLLWFMDLTLALAELDRKPFASYSDAETLARKLRDVENRFKENFGYFHVVSAFLTSMKNREYGIQRWWLDRTPEPDDLHEDTLMEALIQQFPVGEIPMPESCDHADRTIAYALNDVDADERRDIREHIQSCEYCFDLYLDTRMAEAEALEAGEKLDDQVAIEKEDKSVPDVGAVALTTKMKKFFERSISTTFELFRLTTVPMAPAMAMTRSASTYQKKKVKVKNGDVLKSGDKFEIRFKLEQDAYVYVLFKDSAGGIAELFSGKALAGDSYVVDKFRDIDLELDHNTGQEAILLLVSESSIEDFDERIGKLREIGMDYMEDLFPGVIVKALQFEHK